MVIKSLWAFCDYNCMTEYAAKNVKKLSAEGKKIERKRLKEKKEKLKTLAEHKREAQAIFNKFIRLRDAEEPCISCGKFHTGQYHAGHYRSVGSCPELRYEEINCHKQCAPCNNHLSGNLINYRKRLIEKIGLEKVEWLESYHPAKNYTSSEINELKRHYRAKCRELEKQKAA